MMLKRIVLTIILGFFWQICADSQLKVVNTENGQVRGVTAKTLLGEKNFVSFTGIPYAKPPTGKRRFEEAEKPDHWGKLDALQYKSVCIQMDAGRSIGDEDCLYINVFTPDLTFEKRLPVVFYIHGGGFYSGTGNIYGPELLLEHEVILVTFNYRLGPFGFFSLGNQDYSGNLGLKDQLLALKWVNTNIHNFGGDEKHITIHGWSAGCWSVSLHMISPSSQGLFNRAICFSASALVPWILSNVKDHKEIATRFAMSNGVNVTNVHQLIDYLKYDVDADQLAGMAYTGFYNAGINKKAIALPWTPVVEPPNSKNPFLSESPENYFREENYGCSNIDTLFGYADAESYSATSAEIQNPTLLTPFNQSFLFQLPLQGLHYNYSDKDYPELAEEIREFYFGHNDITTHIPEYTDMMNDLLSYPVHQAIKLQSKVSRGRTFYYIFAANLKLSILKKLSKAEAFGLNGNSTHGDDIFYVFRIKNWDDVIDPGTYENLSKDSKDVALIRTMTGIVANFATFGNPIPTKVPIEWKVVEGDKSDINYMTITGDGLRAETNPKARSYTFWNNFFSKHKNRLNVMIEV